MEDKMGESELRQKNYVESMLCLLQATHGKVKVFLMRKTKEPYKGYWILPTRYITHDESAEESVQQILEKIGLEKIYFEQGKVFSAVERMPEDRVISISYIGLIDSVTAQLYQGKTSLEYGWFDIDALPKIAYDHHLVIKSAIEQLRDKIESLDILKILFPSDFTLPEIQKVCEQILGKTLDRRNFRKKFMQMDLIEYTGYKTEGSNGRPAKLYRFKENSESVSTSEF